MAEGAKDHPLLMSAPLVVKTMAGLKTMTRRLVTRATSLVDGYGASKKTWEELTFPRAWVDQGPSPAGNPGPYLKVPRPTEDGAEPVHRVYPKWQVGDRIWIRETFALDCLSVGGGAVNVLWRATDPTMGEAPEHWVQIPDGEMPWVKKLLAKQKHATPVWTPSIYLKRWLSRVTLEVTGVRPELLHEITEEDARAEGVTTDPQQGLMNGKPATLYPMTHRQAFIWLWDAINKDRATWASNPLTWVIGFKRIEADRG